MYFPNKFFAVFTFKNCVNFDFCLFGCFSLKTMLTQTVDFSSVFKDKGGALCHSKYCKQIVKNVKIRVIIAK